MKVFLGDLVHTWGKISVWTMPLNIGQVAGYAQKTCDFPMSVRLFKRPEKMIDAIRTEKPDVVGLSFYVWNTKLNKLVADIAREANPNVLLVGGGPHFTSLNCDEEHSREFFEDAPAIDAFVVNQGEQGFVELLNQFKALDSDVGALRQVAVPGCITNDLTKTDTVHIGSKLENMLDLDEIPSPYLNGMMDEFFDEPISPIIETNRSCPYRCTFCAWGIGTQKLARFSVERVTAEIAYIAERSRKSTSLFIADANFGILDRDKDIADAIATCHEKFGYPMHVNAQWNKTRPDRVVATARNLRGLAQVGASMQSLNPDTLAAIKRRNLELDNIVEMHKSLAGATSAPRMFSELIVGLPEETWQTHLDANRQLMDLDAEIFNYNLHLLPGTEMDACSTRAAYFKRTGWRLHDNSFGIYDGKKVFEGQEVVLETSTMSFDELASFRFIHFLLQMMWGRKYYYDYLMLGKAYGIHPIELVVEVYKICSDSSSPVHAMYKEFCADHSLEHFATYQELCEYWSQEGNFKRLENGDYGKLNFAYTFKVIMEYGEAFSDALLEASRHKSEALSDSEQEEFLSECRTILAFTNALRVKFNDNQEPVARSKARFQHDVLAWQRAGRIGALPASKGNSDHELIMFLEEEQERLLASKLAQFKSHNMNLTLRKMTEYSKPDDFFYKVKEASAEA